MKVPGEAAARVHCLICAEAFAAQPSPARGRRSYERPAPVCQLGLSLVTVLTWVDLQREAAARGPLHLSCPSLFRCIRAQIRFLTWVNGDGMNPALSISLKNLSAHPLLKSAVSTDGYCSTLGGGHDLRRDWYPRSIEQLSSRVYPHRSEV